MRNFAKAIIKRAKQTNKAAHLQSESACAIQANLLSSCDVTLLLRNICGSRSSRAFALLSGSSSSGVYFSDSIAFIVALNGR